MLKRIAVGDLRQGMFLHKFCGSWMDHPFWRSQFLLESTDDLKLVHASAIREVWIDTSKGLDVAHDPTAPAPLESDTVLMALSPDAIPPEPAPPRDVQPTSRAQEMQRAAAIVNRARQAVSSMFQDARMGKAINESVAREVADEITDSVLRNGGALISLARLKTADDYSYMHSVAVCALMVALSRQLGLSDSEARQAGMAGLLHDLGKMDMPQDILNKPGKLTDEEFEQVKRHPVDGYKRLKQAGIVDTVVLDVCLHHHEKLDGTGYPSGLKGDRITLLARMGAVCDIYDAITSNRPYKRGWDPSESIKRMAEWVGDHLDSRVFQAFVRSLGIYPIGSLVLLNTGRLAVVIEQSKTSLLKPVVKAFFSVKSNERLVPTVIDLSDPTCRHSIASREDPDKWKIADLDDIWSGQQLKRH